MCLINWVMSHPYVVRVDATTFERHTASIKILEKCGFECRGVSPEDHKAAESDRQGHRETGDVCKGAKAAVTYTHHFMFASDADN